MLSDYFWSRQFGSIVLGMSIPYVNPQHLENLQRYHPPRKVASDCWMTQLSITTHGPIQKQWTWRCIGPLPIYPLTQMQWLTSRCGGTTKICIRTTSRWYVKNVVGFAPNFLSFFRSDFCFQQLANIRNFAWKFEALSNFNTCTIVSWKFLICFCCCRWESSTGCLQAIRNSVLRVPWLSTKQRFNANRSFLFSDWHNRDKPCQ